MKKILVVDDDKKIRGIYTTLLNNEGFKVKDVSSVNDARELLKRESMDLVLLDIKMPDVNGDVLFEIIQAFHGKIKVIVTSVYPLEEQRQLIPQATDYYDKSQKFDSLLIKIKRALNIIPKEEILIVDDEPKIRALLKRYLKEEGYRTVEAEDGEEALKLLRENKNIALVVLDLLLPALSGLDIFDIIKKEQPEVKIIISSVYEKSEQEFLIFDADDYYYKSEEVSVLVNKISKLLK